MDSIVLHMLQLLGLSVIRIHPRSFYSSKTLHRSSIGAQNILFAKCSVELVANAATHHAFIFEYYQTYMVLGCLFSTIFLQIRWLNQGLARSCPAAINFNVYRNHHFCLFFFRYDASYIVPVFTAFWVLLSGNVFAFLHFAFLHFCNFFLLFRFYRTLSPSCFWIDILSRVDGNDQLPIGFFHLRCVADNFRSGIVNTLYSRVFCKFTPSVACLSGGTFSARVFRNAC